MTACRIDLLRAGYSPLPVQGKRPVIDKWQLRHAANAGEVEHWDTKYPNATNTGALTRLMPTIDIDITLAPAADAIKELAREMSGGSGEFLVRIGNAPKCAIPLRTHAPFKKIAVALIGPDGSAQKIEVLGDGQHVVLFGTHPDTGEPYRWRGGEPGKVKLEDLPCIDEERAREFVKRAAVILVRDYGYNYFEKKPQLFVDNTDQPRAAADIGQLVARIIEGADLHESMVSLSASLAACGLNFSGSVRLLRALMGSSAAARDARWEERFKDVERTVWSAQEKFGRKSAVPPTTPIDLWGKLETPGLPRGILPPVIEDFAFTQGELMGADPAGSRWGRLLYALLPFPIALKFRSKNMTRFGLRRRGCGLHLWANRAQGRAQS